MLTCVTRSWHNDTAPVSLLPLQHNTKACASATNTMWSEPETAKLAQFSAKPQCKYSLHPEKRVAVIDNLKGN